MQKADWVIIWISIQLSIASFFWMKAEKRVSYYEGQQAIWDAQSVAEDGVCGPYDQPSTAERLARKGPHVHS